MKISEYVCCVCGEKHRGYGNSPAPLKNEGRCCDRCNLEKVLPARIGALPADENAPGADGIISSKERNVR